jgi:UDP-N-acetylmuramyl pentapeptide synthase
MPLCLADLATIVHGRLHFGPMPPVSGEWTAIGRIALDSRLVEAGDLFWRLPGLPGQSAGSTQHALFRGAAGVVTTSAEVSAWPGSFCLEVENSFAALARLVDWLDESRQVEQDAERIYLELKDLQLCRYQGLDITPPTCGRPSGERIRSCSRRAA